MENKRFYEFGPFRIDLEERQLLRGEEPVPLAPKAFEALLILVRSSERVVLKDDLMKTLCGSEDSLHSVSCLALSFERCER